MLSPVYTPAPSPGSPNPALGQGQEEFPRKEDKGEEGISGFIAACHKDFANPSPLARRGCRIRSQSRNGKGSGGEWHRTRHRLYLSPSAVTPEESGRYAGTAARSERWPGAAPLNYDMIAIVTPVRRAPAGSHPAGRPTSPGKPKQLHRHSPDIPPPAAGKRSGGTAVALRVSGTARPGCRAPAGCGYAGT